MKSTEANNNKQVFMIFILPNLSKFYSQRFLLRY